jgi:MoaA/NifB/PqqE/SkfB family radical SAM enzyme
LVALGLDELTLSTHGVVRETYERLMRRASFDKFLEVLGRLEEIKRRRGSARPQLRLNYTVNAANLEELAGFFDVYGKYSIRTLQVRPIADLGNTEYTEKDLTPHLGRYNLILQGIEQTCREKGIRLLANYEDVRYERKSTRAALAPEVMVYLSPRDLSKPGLDWRRESYLDYCRRTHWPRRLIKKALTSAAQIETASPYLSYKIIDD